MFHQRITMESSRLRGSPGSIVTRSSSFESKKGVSLASPGFPDKGGSTPPGKQED